MSTETPILSVDFQRLYCDAAVFESFSAWHPIRFSRVLPFQTGDPVIDDARLLAAEAAHLTNPNGANRLAVLEAFALSGLLSAEDADNLKSMLHFFDSDFFELMGEVYANANLFICALRWYREYIAILEGQNSGARSDHEDVYASVGYCLYSLGLFAEAIAWTKSCVGPDLLELTVSSALTDYQAQLLGGRLLTIERAGDRVRYCASTNQDVESARQYSEYLKGALKSATPFHEFYFDWLRADRPAPSRPAGSNPFKYEMDSGCLPRHKMNLLFATVAQADYLSECGNKPEARRLLEEAALLEPAANFIQDRLRTMA